MKIKKSNVMNLYTVPYIVEILKGTLKETLIVLIRQRCSPQFPKMIGILSSFHSFLPSSKVNKKSIVFSKSVQF